MNPHIKNFLMMLCAALVSSVLGGLFGAFIAWLSPEWFGGYRHRNDPGGAIRHAAAVGMVFGLFIGAAAMAFSQLVGAMSGWFGAKSKD
jgi:hypothetical protein